MEVSRKQRICYFDVEGCAAFGKKKLEEAIMETGNKIEVLNHFTEKSNRRILLLLLAVYGISELKSS